MAGHETLFTSSIAIKGGVDSSLTKSLKEMGKQFLGIGKAGKEAGEKGKKGLKEIAEGSESAKKGIENLTEATKELLGPILAIGASFASIKGVFDILDSASEKFKDVRDSAASFRSVLASTDFERQHPEDLEKQVGLFEEQQKRAVSASQGLWGGHLFEEEQNALVAMAGLRPKFTEALVGAIPTAVAKMKGGLGAVTVESVKEEAELIGKSIKSGRASRDLLFNKEQIKAFRAATIDQRINMIMASQYFRGGAAYLEEQKKANPEGFKLIQLQHENAVKQVELGKEWLGVNEEVQGISLELQDVLLDVLREIIIPMEPYLKKALHTVEETVRGVGSFTDWLLRNPDTIQAKLTATLNNAFTAVKAYMNSIGLGWLADDAQFLKKKFDEAQKKPEQKIHLQTLTTDKDKSPASVNARPLFDWKWNDEWRKEVIQGFFNAGDIIPDTFKKLTDSKAWGVSLGTNDKGAADNIEKLKTGQEEFRAQMQKNTDTVRAHDAAMQALKDVQEQMTKMTIGLNAAIDKATGNDLYHFDLALDEATQKLLKFAGGISGGSSGSGGGGGSGGYNSAQWDPILGGIAQKYGISPKLLTGIARAEGVAPGDYNPLGISPGGGGPTHYGSVEAGAAGMDSYVGAHLRHFQEATRTGDIEKFSRWYSPVGAGNDPFHTNAQEAGNIRAHMAHGGIVSRAVHALLGESGPEAVIPLNRGGLAKAGLGAHHFSPNINFTMNLSGHGEDFASEVGEIMRANFEEIMTESFTNYKRIHLS